MLIGLLALSTALAARPDRAALLPDGLLLRGIDGQVAFDTEVQCWFFENRTVLSDGRSTVPKGAKLRLLPSSALDSLQIDLGQRIHSDYRLWAKTTQYEGKKIQHIVFNHRFLPHKKLSYGFLITPKRDSLRREKLTVDQISVLQDKDTKPDG